MAARFSSREARPAWGMAEPPTAADPLHKRKNRAPSPKTGNPQRDARSKGSRVILARPRRTSIGYAGRATPPGEIL